MRDDHDQNGLEQAPLASDMGSTVRAAAGSSVGRMLGAWLLGTLAGAVGAGIDVVATVALGGRFFLVPLLIGIGVGWGVRVGSRGRGGWPYQAVAIVLAYLAIVAGHLPMVPVALGSDLGWQGALLLLVMPIYRGVNSIAGLAMILLGLFQAWRLNRRPRHPERTGAIAVAAEREEESPDAM